MRVFLIGFMSAGKTTLGTRVASRLGVPFFDLDDCVERRAGRTIPEIFAEQGEGAFRALESDALSELVRAEEHGVFATGGGTFTVEANRSLIKKSGISVWLDVAAERLIERSNGDGDGGSGAGRPLFRGAEEARRLLETRRSVYALADERLALDGETEDSDCERLYAFLSDRIEIS